MEVFQAGDNLPKEFEGGVLLIGNFDGVHRGHKALIENAKSKARDKQKICILTFEPHPRHIFRPDDPPFRLTLSDVKRERFEELDIDGYIPLPFDWTLASVPAEKFIETYLDHWIKPAHIVVGYDFHFGQMRKGNAETIRENGYEVSVVKAIQDETNQTISSSRIRQALRHAEPQLANTLLGWEWEIQGTVVKGDQRGRELGYPTANFKLHPKIVHPAYGIYAARVHVEGEPENIWHDAAVNLGIRPMFEVPHAEVESHIFDFNRDIYGKVLRVKPLHFIRSEAKFDSLEALISQIDKDCEIAKQLLKEI